MALSWWIIGTAILILIIIVFKSQDFIYLFTLIKNNIFTIFIIVVILFVSFSIYRISSAYDVNLTTFDGIVGAGKLYFLWIKSIFVNLGRITGYAVKQDWLLNSTNVTR